MTTLSDQVAVRAVRDADEPAILRLLTETMAGGPTGTRSAELWRWKHRRNPFGRSLVLVAEVEGELAGLRTFMRWRFTRHGRTIPAVRAVDTATHPRFQGRGIFTRLTRQALSELAADSNLVFNTPNSNSLPGYLKMGWTIVGRVPIALRVARPLAFARRARHAAHGAPTGSPPATGLPPAREILADIAAVQQLLDQARTPGGRIVTDRDAEYLSWRYGDAPGLGYQGVARWRDDELIGLALGRPRRRGQLAEFTLSEVIVRGDDRSTARALLREVSRCGVDHVATHLEGWSAASAVRRSCGFVQPPGQHMTLVARSVAGRDLGPVPLPYWALSLGDLEVF